MSAFMQNWGVGAQFFLHLGAAIVLGLLIHFIVFGMLERIARHTPTCVDDLLVKHCRGPFRIIILLTILSIMLPLLQFAADGAEHSNRETVDVLAKEFDALDQELARAFTNWAERNGITQQDVAKALNRLIEDAKSEGAG